MTESDPNGNEPHDDEPHEDVQNDAVIASALRTSLIVIMLMGLPVIGILIYLNVNKKKAQSTEVEVTLPEVREATEQAIPLLPLTDVTSQSGVDFVHQSGRYGEKLLPETMGSGVAVFDYNGDGNDDLFFVNSSYWPWDEERKDQPTPCRLYSGDGKFGFSDVSETTQADITLYGMGVAVGDIDNDGDSDLFVSAVGKNRMLRNDNGVFTDVSSSSGTEGDADVWSTSCGFLDFDNDGLLDLFVCNYVAWSKEFDLSQEFTLDGQSRAYGPPKAFAGSYSYLYHNDGDGKFSDVSASAGIQIRSDDTDVPLGKAMGVAPVDINGDGWMDIVVANDTVRNFMFQNNKDGTFTEVGRLTGIAYDRATGNARGAMGIDTADFRGDGSLAIGIGNFANEASALYMARSGGDADHQQFIDAAMYTGFGPPTRQGLTFGLFFFDADLDGRLDVLGANGHLEEEIAKTQATQRYEQPPQLFWNAGRDSQSELVLVDGSCTGQAFCDPIVGRGTAYGDFDGDGDLDVVISTSHSAPRLFRNDQTTDHHWLRVHLTGTDVNRDAIGGIVQLKRGESILSRTVMPTRSYLSQSERTVTFGLGDDTDVQEVIITWPGGKKTTHPINGVDRLVEFTQ
ncbi:ASPIC and UnbV [Rubripirellula tenax]|uniref:ASPIC and UnbV n=1 Tax=Rubripirellula tenax TaxID=2528015 RepID=A0A5C6FCG8_9BACT|nr:CRTAC1 family protein [Rubripirellula tenax]TWU59105.1 ASPIC and UnbV [Rubripirellula tenax]